MAAVLERNRRSTAGKRTSQLGGKAAENDEEFWGHETWNEDEASSGNDSFHESDEDSDNRKDVFDSDFNDSESDHSEEDEAEGVEEERRIRLEERREKSRRGGIISAAAPTAGGSGGSSRSGGTDGSSKGARFDVAQAGRDLMRQKKGARGKIKGTRIFGDGVNATLVLRLPPDFDASRTMMELYRRLHPPSPPAYPYEPDSASASACVSTSASTPTSPPPTSPQKQPHCQSQPQPQPQPQQDEQTDTGEPDDKRGSGSSEEVPEREGDGKPMRMFGKDTQNMSTTSNEFDSREGTKPENEAIDRASSTQDGNGHDHGYDGHATKKAQSASPPSSMSVEVFGSEQEKSSAYASSSSTTKRSPRGAASATTLASTRSRRAASSASASSAASDEIVAENNAHGASSAVLGKRSSRVAAATSSSPTAEPKKNTSKTTTTTTTTTTDDSAEKSFGTNIKNTKNGHDKKKNAKANRTGMGAASAGGATAATAPGGKTGAKKGSAAKQRAVFTQEELLIEAATITEPENERWLLARKRLHEEADETQRAKLHQSHAANSASNKVLQTFVSKRGCYNLLSFPEMDAVPEILARSSKSNSLGNSSGNNKNAKSRVRTEGPTPVHCVITGKRARYKDPKTKMPYFDLASFREIRRRLLAGEELDQRPKQTTKAPPQPLRPPPRPKTQAKPPPAPPITKSRPSTPRSGGADGGGDSGGGTKKSVMTQLHKIENRNATMTTMADSAAAVEAAPSTKQSSASAAAAAAATASSSRAQETVQSKDRTLKMTTRMATVHGCPSKTKTPGETKAKAPAPAAPATARANSPSKKRNATPSPVVDINTSRPAETSSRPPSTLSKQPPANKEEAPKQTKSVPATIDNSARIGPPANNKPTTAPITTATTTPGVINTTHPIGVPIPSSSLANEQPAQKMTTTTKTKTTGGRQAPPSTPCIGPRASASSLPKQEDRLLGITNPTSEVVQSCSNQAPMKLVKLTTSKPHLTPAPAPAPMPAPARTPAPVPAPVPVPAPAPALPVMARAVGLAQTTRTAKSVTNLGPKSPPSVAAPVDNKGMAKVVAVEARRPPCGHSKTSSPFPSAKASVSIPAKARTTATVAAIPAGKAATSGHEGTMAKPSKPTFRANEPGTSSAPLKTPSATTRMAAPTASSAPVPTYASVPATMATATATPPAMASVAKLTATVAAATTTTTRPPPTTIRPPPTTKTSAATTTTSAAAAPTPLHPINSISMAAALAERALARHQAKMSAARKAKSSQVSPASTLATASSAPVSAAPPSSSFSSSSVIRDRKRQHQQQSSPYPSPGGHGAVLTHVNNALSSTSTSSRGSQRNAMMGGGRGGNVGVVGNALHNRHHHHHGTTINPLPQPASDSYAQHVDKKPRASPSTAWMIQNALEAYRQQQRYSVVMGTGMMTTATATTTTTTSTNSKVADAVARTNNDNTSRKK